MAISMISNKEKAYKEKHLLSNIIVDTLGLGCFFVSVFVFVFVFRPAVQGAHDILIQNLVASARRLSLKLMSQQ